ncbi:hypothetical protein, partial [Luethyella okanaganae]
LLPRPTLTVTPRNSAVAGRLLTIAFLPRLTGAAVARSPLPLAARGSSAIAILVWTLPTPTKRSGCVVLAVTVIALWTTTPG